MILVTGAAGNSGRAVVAEFARRRVPVRALVRDPAKADSLRRLGDVEVVEGDMLRPNSLGRALQGVDRALMVSTSEPAMLETQATFIDAAKAAGVRHIVKFSGLESGLGFNQDNFRFTRNHQQVERYLEGSGLDWTHLQPGQFMQVYLRAARSVAASGELALPAGTIALAPIDIADIAKVAFQVLTTDGHVGMAYPMTGPQALTMYEVAGLISTAIGKHVDYVPITPEQSWERALATGLPPEIAEALFEQATERLRHPRTHVRLETHARFGVQPTAFADFIQRYKHLFD